MTIFYIFSRIMEKSVHFYKHLLKKMKLIDVWQTKCTTRSLLHIFYSLRRMREPSRDG